MSCLLCGRVGQAEPAPAVYNASAPSFHGMFDGPEDKSVIEAEIERLDRIILALAKQRSRLRQKLNRKSSPIGRLPGDVLANIFQQFVPTHESLYLRSISREDKEEQRRAYVPQYPHLLSQVCVRWREVALSNPILWSSLILGVTKDTESRCAAKLNLFLRHSSNLPFSLEITILQETMPEFPDSLGNPRLIEAILFRSNYSRRFAGLYLTFAPWAWFSHASMSALPSLRDLRWSYAAPGGTKNPKYHEYSDYADMIYVYPVGPDECSFNELVSLNSLCLKRWLSSATFPLPPNITVLRLHDFSCTEAAAFLRQCPQIVEFHLLGERSRGFEEPEDTIHLPHLQVFAWSGERRGYPFLDLLSLPNVKKVAIALNQSDGNELTFDPRVVDFFKRLPLQTITHLELFKCIPDENLYQLISPFSNLQSLYLWTPGFEGRTLTLTLDRLFKVECPFPFPGLSELIVYPSSKLKRPYHEDEECTFRLSSSLITLIEERSETSDTPFCLVLGGVEWNTRTTIASLTARYSTAQEEGKLKICYRPTWHSPYIITFLNDEELET